MERANREQVRIEKKKQADALASDRYFVPPERAVELLEAVLLPGDRICLEGDNQKQAAFLAESLTKVDPKRVHDVKLAISAVILPEYLDLFERGICAELDFSYAGPQAHRLARMVAEKKVRIGSLHTYPELYARYFSDLPLDVCCLAAEKADLAGNLYTGPNTEDTPAIVEATAFHNGIVIVQVNEIVERLPRVDIPADWVDYIIRAPNPYLIRPLFTRDPARMDEIMILMGMMALKGIYAEYLPRGLNHGIGFNTACIELLLPTYGIELGLKGKACTHWLLNPHPTLIPAIESGFVERVMTVGAEVGMNDYVAAHPGIFPVGHDGSMRSNRAFGQLTGHYLDMFIGSALEIDLQGNSSTVTADRLVGFGGAPNLGCDPRARRHHSPAWLKAGRECYDPPRAPRGRKLVVQIVETFQTGLKPTFVEKLDAWNIQQTAGLSLPPIMIYGDDVSHIVTEEGIANLLLCRTAEEREQAVRGVAGFTPAGLARDQAAVENLRDRGIIRRAEDLGIKKTDVTRDILAARSIRDLVEWSGGLYHPPDEYRNW